MSELVLVATALEARALFGRSPEGLETLDLGAGRRLGLVGFGLAAAGAFAARHIAGCEPERLLLCGIAGSLDLDRAPPGAVFCGSRVRSLGIGAGSGARHLSPGELGFPESPEGGDEIDLLPVPGHRHAAIVSVAAASADAAEAALVRARHPEHLLEDMETWAVALAARAFDRPLRVLRAVSNEAGNRDREHWRAAEALAALREAVATAC